MSLNLYSPASGRYVRLENVNDPTFSSGVMGPGFGVEPEKGVVYAPADGTISMIFPTGHAMGFTMENGLEVLVHIGINTVDLNGKGFKVLKKENERVKAHEAVIEFDMDTIQAAGLDTTVITIFTNGDEYDVDILPADAVTQNTQLAKAEVRKTEAKAAKAEGTKDTSKYEYGKMCSEILEAIGGSKNVKNVFHCVTRLRIVPVNRDIVDMDKLNSVSGLLKVIESSGQLQCVVGTTVAEVYADFLEIAGKRRGGGKSGACGRGCEGEKAEHHHTGSEYAGFLRNTGSVRNRCRRYD